MAKVLVSDTLSQNGLDILAAAPGIEFTYKPGLKEDDLAKEIPGYDGLVIRSDSKVTAKVLAAADSLKVVGRAGIGIDNVDVKEASRRGIIVMNTPTGNAVTTAEHAIALMMSLARKIPAASASMKQGGWEKKAFGGRELSGKTIGVVGLGNIGRLVAERAQGLKMHVIGFDPVMNKERASELGVQLVSLDELFAQADVITVHTPLTAHTKGLVNDAAVQKMKKGVLLINAARGGIFEDEALLKGLESGKIGGVAVDVFEEEPPGITPLIAHPLVVATPHLGASTTEAQLRVAVEVCEQVTAYLNTGEISNSVNVPSVPRGLAPVLGPYAILGKCLGEFLGQVESLEPTSVEVAYAGDASTLQMASVSNAVLAGVLGRFLEEPINPVNAPMVAADRGIKVVEHKTSEAPKFSTLLSLSVTGKDGKTVSVSGTLAADGSPRLVAWGNYSIDAHIEGPILVIRNQDKPGVIGAVGTLLGAAAINVERMQMGLDKDAAEAMSVWGLSQAPSAELLEKIRAHESVQKAFSLLIG